MQSRVQPSGGSEPSCGSEIVPVRCLIAFPAAIAAGELYEILHARAYLAKARSLYAWTRKHLYDPTSGAVFDQVCWTTSGTGRISTIDRSTYTYNQGTLTSSAPPISSTA
jgi:predicted alpha-1,6-mannanase (GH76 family)